MTTEETPDDLPLRWSLAAVAGLAAGIALLTGILMGVRTGMGVMVGGVIATINLWVFMHIVRGVLGGGRHGRLWVLAAILKLGGLLGGAWLLMRTGFCSGGQLAIGYCALPLGIVVGSLVAPRPPDERNGAGRDAD